MSPWEIKYRTDTQQCENTYWDGRNLRYRLHEARDKERAIQLEKRTLLRKLERTERQAEQIRMEKDAVKREMRRHYAEESDLLQNHTNYFTRLITERRREKPAVYSDTDTDGTTDHEDDQTRTVDTSTSSSSRSKRARVVVTRSEQVQTEVQPEVQGKPTLEIKVEPKVEEADD